MSFKRFLHIYRLPITAVLLGIFFTCILTCATAVYMNKNDALNKKMDKYIEDMNSVRETDLTEVETITDSSFASETTADLEREVAIKNSLTSFDETSTATDADAAVEHIPLNGKKVYLTFDDGPSENTQKILDILDEYNVKATFFVVEADGKYADQLKAIADDGQTIGLHSKSHIYSELYSSMDAFKADVDGVHDWVYDLTGIDSRLYRFPGGSSNIVSDIDKNDCIAYLNDKGYDYYDWNAESRDAENLYLSPEQLNQNVMSYVRASAGDSIVLMHDLDYHDNTVKALPALIETLIQEGYEILPIDDKAPHMHHYEVD